MRNTYYTWSKKNRALQLGEPDNELLCQDQERGSPEALAIRKNSGDLLRRALEALSPRLRELLVLRELKEMSYREIADIAGMPMGTVMSTLSRARRCLRQSVMDLTTSCE